MTLSLSMRTRATCSCLLPSVTLSRHWHLTDPFVLFPKMYTQEYGFTLLHQYVKNIQCYPIPEHKQLIHRYIIKVQILGYIYAPRCFMFEADEAFHTYNTSVIIRIPVQYLPGLWTSAVPKLFRGNLGMSWHFFRSHPLNPSNSDFGINTQPKKPTCLLLLETQSLFCLR
jgi:hypothetical protein